jgi:spore coat protein U-like protein
MDVTAHQPADRSAQRAWSLGVAAAIAMFGANPAAAQTSGTTNMAVTARLQPSCSFDGTAVGQFPVIRNNAGTDADWVMIRFRCSEGLAISASVDSGQHAASGQRRMLATVAGAPAYLPYEIYTTAARNTPFPTTAPTPGSGSTGRTATGGFEDIHFYARIPAQAALPLAGNYEDVIRVTLTW